MEKVETETKQKKKSKNQNEQHNSIYHSANLTFYYVYYKGWIKLTFGDRKIEKYKFHNFKYLIGVNNVDIDKTIISNITTYDDKSFRYFIRYKDDKKFYLVYSAVKNEQIFRNFH